MGVRPRFDGLVHRRHRFGRGTRRLPQATRLGEFVAASQPSPAPGGLLRDLAGNRRARRFRGASSCSSIFGRPGASRACARCRRSSGCKPGSATGSRSWRCREDRGGGKAVEPFIEKLGLKSVKIYIDPKSAVGQAFEVRGLPTSR